MFSEEKKNFDTCCSLFRERVKLPNKRGMAIVPYRSKKFGDAFFLEFHSVSSEDATRLDTGDVKILIGFQQAIHFCPWCGKNLKEYYQKIFNYLPYLLWEERDSGGGTT